MLRGSVLFKYEKTVINVKHVAIKTKAQYTSFILSTFCLFGSMITYICSKIIYIEYF